MPWILIACLISTIALIVSGFAILGALHTSAEIANLRGSLSSWEKSERLTASKLAELADVRDGIEKGNALLYRIAQRETMRDRRANGAASEQLPSDPAALKAYLRQKAGLVAGKVPPHK